MGGRKQNLSATLGLPEHLSVALEKKAEEEGREPWDIVLDAIARYVGGPGARTVGAATCDALRQGLTNREAMDYVSREMGAETTPDSVRWWRSKLRRDGEDIPKDAEIKTRRKQGAG